MSQSEDKKDRKNSEVKEEQEETRLPVGELKWSKEQKEKEVRETENKEELNKEEENPVKEDQSVKKNSVHSEISATLLDIDVEKEQQSHISSNQEEDKKKKQPDPLENIEDTLTPIDFKTYEFDSEQLKAIEQELNALNPQKLEEELQTLHQPNEKQHQKFEEFDEEDDDETVRSDNKWLKRSIWMIGVPALLVIVLFVSLVIGHTVVGGQPVGDIFDMTMWMHVYNLIYS